MADSVRTLILDNIVTTIAAIAKGASYSRTVRTCKRNVQTMPDVPQWDAVWIERTNDAVEPRCGVMVCTMTVLLAGMVHAFGAVGEAVDALRADIEKALSVDVTRSGNAIDTRVVSSEEAVYETEEPLGGLTVKLEVTYRYRAGDPYTRA